MSSESIFDRLRVLRMLEGSARSTVPFIPQVTAADCGAACLAMVLARHGRQVSLEELRTALGIGRGGVDALALTETARRYGLRSQLVSVELDQLGYVGKNAILFWSFNHFVVLEAVLDKGIRIVDPAVGKRLVPMEEVSRRFTGIVITLELMDDFRRGGSVPTGMRRYVAVLRRHKGLVSQVVTTSVLIQLLALAGPFFTGWLVDQVIPRQDTQLLTLLCVAVPLICGFAFLADRIRGLFSLHLRTHIDVETTSAFVEHLISLPYGFFQIRTAGDLLMRVNSNVVVREILASGAVSTLLDGMLVNGYLLVLYLSSVKLGLLVTFFCALQVILFLVFKGRQRELLAEGLEAQSKAQSYQVEMLTGIETIKLLGAEFRSLERWAALFTDSQNVDLERGRFESLSSSISGAVRYSASLVVLLVGTSLVLDGELSMGTMLALSAMTSGLLTPVANLVASATRFQLLVSYAARIDDVMQVSEDRAPATQLDVRLTGMLSVNDVSFSYPGGSGLQLENISFEVRPGEHVAIVGPSGSGKSTLIKLLAGLYSPSAGSISYDDHDMARLRASTLRSQVALVPQDSQLFATTIRENIAFGWPGATLAGIIAAAKLAGIHDQVLGMSMGYDTVLADRGLSLSGGQRQRIALARALVRRPAILILDEATSALDAETEREVVSTISRLPITRVTVAHRLSTVKHADRILVFDAGKLTETGSHPELLTQNGRYAALVHAQL